MATEDIVKVLDEIRRAEITASIQYMAHHGEYENLGMEGLAKMSKKEAIEEMQHAEVLGERIYFLGGRPTHTPLRDAESSEDVLEMIAQDVKLEEEAIERLNAAIVLCLEEKDAGTRLMLEPILVDEERHIDELRMILTQIERFGGGPMGAMMCVCGSGVPMGGGHPA